MEKPAEILLRRIDQRLEDLGGKPAGKTRWWLSMQVTDRKRHGVVTDIERKGFLPREPTLRRIADALETTTDYLMGRTDIADQVISEARLGDRLTPYRSEAPRAPGIPLVGTGDCADLEVDVDGQLQRIERSSFDPEAAVRYIERPPALLGDNTAYAIYFHGSSMEPRFFAGEVGIVQPSRPAGPGDFVVVQLNNGQSDDVVTVLVKRLVRQNSAWIDLEQFNPPLIFRLPRSQVARIQRIIPPTELLIL